MPKHKTVRLHDHAGAGRVLAAVAERPQGAVISRQIDMDGGAVEQCHDPQTCLRLLTKKQFDVVVLDLTLTMDSDVELVSFIRRQHPATQLILLFQISQLDRAMDGIRKGAYFYMPLESKPVDIAYVVRNALRQKHTQRTIHIAEQQAFEEMLGNTPAMRRVLEVIRKVAPTDSTVLLLGESGTGKEVFANAIHQLSPRYDHPFVAVNCAALPENLLESELFGHVKGAFTGAQGDKRGLFEEADGGAIFLDEIGDMALVTQAKLLRVLQNGEIRRVGATVPQRVNVRVIAATNRDLEKAVADHSFREDLYFRLNVVQVRIPPLRERMDALPKLILHFLARFNGLYGKNILGFEEDAAQRLQSYAFPGNVRELESIIAHAVIMADGERIKVTDLPDNVRFSYGNKLALPNYAEERLPTLGEMEEKLIRTTLERCNGNQLEAARSLGISRSTLWRKLREMGVNRKGEDAIG